MSHETHWQGTPVELVNPVDAGNPSWDELTEDQKMDLTDQDNYLLDPIEPEDPYDL